MGRTDRQTPYVYSLQSCGKKIEQIGMWIHVDLVTAVTTVYWVIDPRVYFITMSIPLQSANTSLIISVINSSKANRHCHVKSLVVNFVRVYLQGKSIHRAQSRGYRYFDNR